MKSDGEQKFSNYTKSNLQLITYHLQLSQDTCGKPIKADGEIICSNQRKFTLHLTAYTLHLPQWGTEVIKPHQI
jgi:hypothetical protein